MKLRFACLAAALALTPFTVRSQEPAAKPSPDLAGLAHVALRVHDLAASVAFYEKLGFVNAFSLSKDGQVYEAFIKINDRQFIELYPSTAKDPQIGFLHVCFEGKNLQSVHDYYVAQGLTPNAVRTAGAGNLLFTMPGPDTLTGPQNMEYTQYMPGSLHSKDFGQHLGEGRISTQLIAAAIAFTNPAAASAFYQDKVSFVPHKLAPNSLSSVYAIPGAPDESIHIDSPELGYKTRITFAAETARAQLTLKARGIPYEKTPGSSGGDLLLIDPDGNEIILHRGL
jgi:catechol 2,3-dioxygenase-like lactoylglutathione lyase family enzyme